MPNRSALFFSTNGDQKVGNELGFSKSYQGANVIIWKSSEWRGGALAIPNAGDGILLMAQISGANTLTWKKNEIASKSDLAASQSNPYVVTLQNAINSSLFSSAQYRSRRTEGGTGAAAYGFENVGVNSGALYLDPSDYKLHFINYDGKKFVINWTAEN